MKQRDILHNDVDFIEVIKSNVTAYSLYRFGRSLGEYYFQIQVIRYSMRQFTLGLVETDILHYSTYLISNTLTTLFVLSQTTPRPIHSKLFFF